MAWNTPKIPEGWVELARRIVTIMGAIWGLVKLWKEWRKDG